MSGTPVTTSDVTAASTIYLTPYTGNTIALYESATGEWIEVRSGEVSLSLSALTSGKNYDVFAYLKADNTLGLALSAWTNDTTRTDTVSRQDGVLVKDASQGYRLVGTIRTTGTTTTEDSVSKRFVWNVANRVPRLLQVTESTGSWSYSTGSYRAANNNAANCFEWVAGDAQLIEITARALTSSTSISTAAAGVGIDSTSVQSAQVFGCDIPSSGFAIQHSAIYRGYPAVGYHKATWLEYGGANQTWYGHPSAAYQSGMIGEVMV
jgi:hypothetical protein